MTDEELNERFAQLAEAVSRVAEAGTVGMRELREVILGQQTSMRELRDIVLGQQTSMRELRDIVLGQQASLGLLSRMLLESQERAAEDRASQAQVVQEIRTEIQQVHERQAESDRRFDVLLNEIRYLIRQQQPPEADNS
jgi:hypothetical protein